MFPLKDNVPTRSFPILTVLFIVVNVLVYFGFQEGGFSTVDEEKVVEYGAVPYEVTHPGEECRLDEQQSKLDCADHGEETQVPVYLTLLTSMFMHGGLLHLGGNMLFLWIFGNNIEDSMGRWRFALFYVLGGLAALGAQTAIDPDAAIPTVGASGAIAAVLGGYALLYPRARVLTLIFIIFFITLVELPAMLVLGGWFLLQLFYGTSELTQPVAGEGGGVAYFAHIGGFVFGMLLIKLFANDVHEDYASANRAPVS